MKKGDILTEPVILASASPRRISLFKLLHIPFEVIPVTVKELESKELTAREIAITNAIIKAMIASDQAPSNTVIGADTVVEIDGQSLGKPADLEHAQQLLKLLSGKIHSVITGVCLWCKHKAKIHVFFETTFVKFKPLPDYVIKTYLELVNVLDKAGAYAIQEHPELIIDEINGSWSNVVGLPIERVAIELEKWFEIAPGTLLERVSSAIKPEVFTYL